MAKLITLDKTIEEQTTERAISIIYGAAVSCDNAITRLKELAADRGGKAALLAELGDLAQPIGSAALAVKALVEELSNKKPEAF